MAAPRNYLYHLITRVAPSRTELTAETAESLLLGSVRATLAVQSRTHRSIEHRCEESGILCPPSRYRADDNENEVYIWNERNKGRRKWSCLFFKLNFLILSVIFPIYIFIYRKVCKLWSLWCSSNFH